MEYTGWLSLMAAGATLRWAVGDVVPGVDLALTGLIYLIAGAVGVLISLLTWSLRRWDAYVERDQVRGPGR